MFSLSLSLSLPRTVRNSKLPLNLRFLLLCFLSSYLLPHVIFHKGLNEDVGILPICQNILKFDFTREDTLPDKILVHLNVLSPGVEDGVLR